MIINGAVVNILVQEVFIWVSDNVLGRNSRKGNYRVSALLCGTSLLTSRCLGRRVAPVIPSGRTLLPWRPGLEDLHARLEAGGGMQKGPRSLPMLFEPTPCRAELPPAGITS